MSIAITEVPYMGTLEAYVGLAPYQYQFSNPACSYPFFLNGCALYEGNFPLQMGGNGLKFFYGSIPWFESDPTTTANAGPMVQFAGGTISSLRGVWDYSALLPVPTTYLPLKTGVPYQTPLPCCDDWNGNLFIDGSYGSASWIPPATYTYQVSQTSLPAYLAGNTSAAFSATTTTQGMEYDGLAVGVKRGSPFVVRDALTLLPVFMSLGQYGSISWSQDVYSGGTYSGGVWTYGPIIVDVGGPAAIISPYGETNIQAVSMSSRYGTSICYWENPSPAGIVATQLWDYSQGLASGQMAGQSSYLVLQRLEDNVLTSPGVLGPVNNHRSVITPQGDFLVQIFGSSLFFLIKGDFSAYYQIDLYPLSSDAAVAITEAASLCYGMDEAGIMWFQGPTDTSGHALLYATVAAPRYAFTQTVGPQGVISLPCTPCCRLKTGIVL